MSGSVINNIQAGNLLFSPRTNTGCCRSFGKPPKKIQAKHERNHIKMMRKLVLENDRLNTERLILIPFTMEICKNLINNDFGDLFRMGLKKGKGWPDADAIETLPKIIANLSKVESPTGFESWMIIKNDTFEVIGDLGFKGFNHEGENIDIGYGIIKEERRKGYAEEAATALINWAFSNDIVKEITARCLLGNISSINLLKKFNFIETRQDSEMTYWLLQNTKYQKS
jgi:[ribosomal protein S5]-alanine N-acetyltransferase